MSTKIENISNYKIIRKIGEGGFGKVFLAEKNNSFFALKLIDKDKGIREINSFEKYKKLADSQKSFIIPILDSGEYDEYFYYVMPLADTLKSSTEFAPTDFRWVEKSLSKLIELKTDLPDTSWFSREEIFEIIETIFDSVIFLNSNGVIHRDIKPSNILFLNNKVALSDFGLLADDKRDISSMGTPVFSAPTWFLNTGGNPDVYGIAATFYMLISGNYPDNIGNPNHVIPEKIKQNISSSNKEQYMHWHRCILRAISENPTSRFVRIEDFKNAIFSTDFDSSKNYSLTAPKKKNNFNILVGVALIALCIGGYFIFSKSSPTETQTIFNEENIEGYQEGILKNYALSDEQYREIYEKGYQDEASGIMIENHAKWIADIKKELKNEEIFYASLKKNYDKEMENPQQITLAAGETLENYKFEKTQSLKTFEDIINKKKKQISDESEYRKYIIEEYTTIDFLQRQKSSSNSSEE